VSGSLESGLAQALQHAREFAGQGEDEAAKQAYLDVLRRDPTHLSALNELGSLAYAGGYRSAARTAYQQALRHHPDNKIVCVNLGNLLREEHDLSGARLQYETALRVDPEFHEAHQGLAAVLFDLGEEGAVFHWRKGFAGHAVVVRPYRGTGYGVPLLMLVSARAGNIPTQLWVDNRRFAVTAIYAEFYEPSWVLPPHALILNAIGDADLCGTALEHAAAIVARSAAPIINAPASVRRTGRAENSRRLAAIEGVVAPKMRELSPAEVLAAADLRYPLLLRRPGFHTGEHFVLVESPAALAATVAALAGDELLLIEFLDARGKDRMVRKYRVMFVGGTIYPLHLAISADWKVHYFTSKMAEDAAYRDEERRFLEDMPGVLGSRAMAALTEVRAVLGLDYGGIDFGLAVDGSILLFEANATMVVFPPDPDPIWDYRREALTRVLDAATQMLVSRAL
jgi:hypothetical protein